MGGVTDMRKLKFVLAVFFFTIFTLFCIWASG
jgi:hypothetical protein